MEARWLLFRATGDQSHLDCAMALLDESVADLDDETRQSALAAFRLNRQIMAAAKKRGL